uniref:phosphoglycerate dehydrogenase n=1 Tax=Candidatus Enterococcus willemsii TaxID=1857215 RepID=UPI00403F0B8C
MKIVITPRGFANYGQQEIQKLKDKGLDVDFNDTGAAYSVDVFLEKCKDADAVIVGVDKMNRAFLEQCKNLKVICKFGVGVDNIDIDYAEKNNIAVERTLGTNTNAVAEHVIALMFAQAKNIVATVEMVKNGGWEKPTGFELFNKTIGIVGFGAIGQQVAYYAKGLGMKVIIFDVVPISKEKLQAFDAKQVPFEEILIEGDYISLHLPLTVNTKNIISKKEFQLMKSSACLINTARGGIVDEDALLEALKSKEIRSACFDVFSTEPPEKNHVLLQQANFILTSHIAARTVEAERRTCQTATKIILNTLGLEERKH